MGVGGLAADQSYPYPCPPPCPNPLPSIAPQQPPPSPPPLQVLRRRREEPVLSLPPARMEQDTLRPPHILLQQNTVCHTLPHPTATKHLCVALARTPLVAADVLWSVTPAARACPRLRTSRWASCVLHSVTNCDIWHRFRAGRLFHPTRPPLLSNLPLQHPLASPSTPASCRCK